MTTDIAPDPAALRLSFRTYPEPVRHESMGRDGKLHTTVHHGALRVEWDSPLGPFTLMLDQLDDQGEAYEDLRPEYARMMAEAYAKAAR